jgi:ABC-2 type transport system ATP-binding protein
LAVVEMDVYGMPPEVVERLRGLPFVDTVSVENVDQRQALRVQTRRGSEAVPDLMALLTGLRVGRVVVREPTLEDAYVRLVGGDE